MGTRLTSPSVPKTAAEYRAELDELLAGMQRMDEQSDRTWADIARLKAETEVIKADNEVIKARLQSRLDALEARFR